MAGEEFELTFREHVISSLATLEEGQKTMIASSSAIMADHERRLRDIQTHQDKASGRASVLGFLGGGIAATLITTVLGHLKAIFG